MIHSILFSLDKHFQATFLFKIVQINYQQSRKQCKHMNLTLRNCIHYHHILVTNIMTVVALYVGYIHTNTHPPIHISLHTLGLQGNDRIEIANLPMLQHRYRLYTIEKKETIFSLIPSLYSVPPVSLFLRISFPGQQCLCLPILFSLVLFLVFTLSVCPLLVSIHFKFELPLNS